MSVPAVDVTSIIAERLEGLGFDIRYDDDCESIFEALEQVKFIRTDKIEELQNEATALLSMIRFIN